MTAGVESCPFCKLVREYEPFRHDENIEQVHDYVFKVTPLNPVTPGHELFLPVSHVMHAAVVPNVTGLVMEAASRWAKRFPTQPFNLITSAGTAATQTIHHLHVHYVPRRPDDGLLLPWTNQHTEGTPE